MRTSRALGVIVAVAMVVAACGDDSDEAADTAASAATNAVAATDAPSATDAAADGAACPEAPFTGTIERTVESETSSGVNPAAVRSDGELVSAYAYYFGLRSGSYTVYVGDHQMDEASVGNETLTAPEGGLLASIFIQERDPISAGQVVPFTFVSIVDTGGGPEINGFGADEVVGQMTIIAVDDDRLCFEIQSSDPQQEINGTVSAVIAG